MQKNHQQEQAIRRASMTRWRQVVVQSVRDLWASNVMEWAASLAFYALLSLFPLLIVIIVAFSFVAEPEWAAERAINLLDQFLPEGEAGVEAIIDDAIAQRGRVGVLSFVVLLVTGQRILGGLSKGLNHVSDVNVLDETVKREAAVEIALFVGLVGLALLAFSSDFIVEVLWSAAWKLPGPDAVLVEGAQAVLRPLLLFLLFIYAFVPRGKRFWRAAAIGSAVSTVLFLLAHGVFVIIFDKLWENLSLIYGSMAMSALLLSWAWYVALITLASGGLASHIKTMLLEDRSGSEASQRHVAPQSGAGGG